MKKLMIAAACAAMVGGAFASCDDPEDPVTANCAAVYNVSVTLKTLAAKNKSTTTKVECEDPVTVSSCYLVSGTRKYSGLIASCECDCDCAGIVANAKTYFWCTTLKTAYCDSTIALDNAVRFGAATSDKSTKVAATVAITADSVAIAGAGIGSYSKSYGRISSISGYIAGLVDAPVCTVKCEDPLTAYGFNICDSEAITPDTVPAYGTWSIKYNSGYSKKYMNDSTYVEKKLLPSYFSSCLN